MDYDIGVASDRGGEVGVYTCRRESKVLKVETSGKQEHGNSHVALEFSEACQCVTIYGLFFFRFKTFFGKFFLICLF